MTVEVDVPKKSAKSKKSKKQRNRNRPTRLKPQKNQSFLFSYIFTSKTFFSFLSHNFHLLHDSHSQLQYPNTPIISSLSFLFPHPPPAMNPTPVPVLPIPQDPQNKTKHPQRYSNRYQPSKRTKEHQLENVMTRYTRMLKA